MGAAGWLIAVFRSAGAVAANGAALPWWLVAVGKLQLG